jgi:uncharacterized protein (TIGR02996 family)
MGDETAFLQAIRAAPQDDGLLLVYADWLEERGDRRAEFLRVQAALAGLKPRNPRRAILLKRLRELRTGIETAWLVLVDRTRIENCGLQCQFECSWKWEQLQPTENDCIRNCETCERQVHYCHSVRQARHHARQGECVAIDSTLVRKPKDLAVRRQAGPEHQVTIRMGLMEPSEPVPAGNNEEETQGGWQRRPRDGKRGRNRGRRER